MARSKTIKLFLIDGEATGRIKCSLANWTGIAYKIPRTTLDKCKNIDYLQQSGVYFLFGTDEKYDQIVYVGQAGVRKKSRSPSAIGRRFQSNRIPNGIRLFVGFFLYVPQ